MFTGPNRYNMYGGQPIHFANLRHTLLQYEPPPPLYTERPTDGYHSSSPELEPKNRTEFL